MKKIISKLLILVMLIPSFAALEVSAAPKGGDFEFKTNVLKELGIINEAITTESIVLRGEWAVTLYNILNYKNGIDAPEGGKQIFEDVDSYHYLNGYLERLYTAGIISGTGGGKFNSDEAIRGVDAVAALLRVGGWSAYMSGYENYEKGIAEAARAADLKASITERDELTYKEIIPVLYDALFMNTLSVSSELNASGTIYKPAGELATELMGLSYIEGVLTGVGSVSLISEGGKQGSLSVEGSLYDTDPESGNLEKLLGIKVLCFIDDDDTAVAVIPYPYEEKVIYSGDILEFEDDVYSVREDERKKKYTMEEGFYVMYNGRRPSGIANMLPTYGSVKLIDNDGDGRYELAAVTESEIFYVNSVNTKNNELLTEDVSLSPRTLKLSDYDEVTITADGIQIDISALTVGAIVAVSSSDDASIMKIELLRDTVSGAVRSSDDEEIYIDDKAYDYAPVFYKKRKVEIGMSVELTLDSFGKAVAISISEKKGIQAVYVMNVFFDDDEQAVMLKGLNENGSIKKYYCTEKVKLDGETIKDGEVLAEYFKRENEGKKETIQQLVLVELDSSGKIKMIDRADAWDSVTRNGNMLRKRDVASKTYKFFGSFGNEILINSNTKIFSVPSKNSDDAKYSVKKMSDLTNDRGYSFEQYRATDDLVAYEEYILLKDQTFGGASSSSRDVVISRVSPVLNSDDEIIERVTGMQGVNEVSFETDGEYSVIDKGYKSGDVVSFSFDMNGKISDSTLQYSFGNDSVENTYPFNEGYRVLGYAHDVMDNTIFIGKESGENADLLYSDTRVKMVVIYSASEKTARVGSLNEAKTFKNSSNACSKVYVQTMGGEPYFIVIYSE